MNYLSWRDQALDEMRCGLSPLFFIRLIDWGYLLGGQIKRKPIVIKVGKGYDVHQLGDIIKAKSGKSEGG